MKVLVGSVKQMQDAGEPVLMGCLKKGVLITKKGCTFQFTEVIKSKKVGGVFAECKEENLEATMHKVYSEKLNT